ncbi:MAG: hypothetical protein J0H74_16305 [Chitinophagaceae bacterium]|nr:hypothetical protein [Chitinophagaceae bacterium]
MKPFFPLCILLFAACESPSSQIKKSFQTVNASLEKSNQVVLAKGQYALAYNNIQLHRDKNPQLAAKADSLYAMAEEARLYVDQLKQRLLAVDSVGETIGPAEKLLVHTPAGDSILTYLQKISWYAHGGLTTKEKTHRLDSALNEARNSSGEKDWMSAYFKQTPTVGALTILSKIQSDFLHAASITLEDIDQHL